MRTNRWLIGGLIASLALNLLLVGMVIGRLSGFGPPPGMGPDPTAGFFRVLGFLSDERRAAITPELREKMGKVMPMLRKLRHDQHDVFAALTAEPFDASALAQTLADLRTNLTMAQVASHQSFVEMAKSLTPDERRALANALRRPPHRLRPPGSSPHREQPPFGMHPGSGGLEPPEENR